MIRVMALAAAGPAPLADAVTACPAEKLVGEPGHHADFATAVRAALSDALTAVPAAERGATPVVLAVNALCVAAASHFAARCRDNGRRLRPFESVRLEVAELIRGAGEPDGWAGPCYLMAGPADTHQAVLAATVMRRRHPAVLAGELLLTGGDGKTPEGLVVMAAVDPPLPPDGEVAGSARSLLLAIARTETEVVS